ncbi:MAG: stress response translation initiation inhibitor YciH [Desulfuromonadales bacterium]
MTTWADSIPVYSTETGRIKQKSPSQQPVVKKSDGIVRMRRETKGRNGGTVIVIDGIPGSATEVKELAGLLKKKCGCGGTVKDGIIEIQGDHRDLLLRELEARGYRVKLAGG